MVRFQIRATALQQNRNLEPLETYLSRCLCVFIFAFIFKQAGDACLLFAHFISPQGSINPA